MIDCKIETETVRRLTVRANQSVTLSCDELAEILRVAPRTLQARRRALEAEGMPRRVPGTQVYSRAAVAAWIDGRGGAPANADQHVADARAALEARLDRPCWPEGGEGEV